MHYCSFCEFRCFEYQILLKHIRQTHANDPNFLIYCAFCGMSFRKWDSFRKHIHQRHGVHNQPEQSNENHQSSSSLDNQLQEVPCQFLAEANEYLAVNEQLNDRSWDSALYLMKVTNSLCLNHSEVETITSSTQWMVDSVCKEISERLKSHLIEHDIDKDIIQDIDEMCTPGDLFEMLDSRHKRESYFQKHFNYTEPQPIFLGDEWERRVVNNERRLTCVKQYGYYIDLFLTLKGLFSNPAVTNELETSHESTDNILRDFCDGQFYQQHEVFSKHKDALQFIVYYDDIEVANALGSKAGTHKLGCFYFTLANINPAYRSSLKTMFLLAIAKSENLKTYTSDALLQRFVEQMNLLSQGYELELSNGQRKLIYGGVICVVGDVPASNFLAGFKQGVGYALRKCRMCLAVQPDMSTKFHASEFVHRDSKSHLEFLALIEEDGGSHSRHSVTYGINSRSPLMSLTGFDITKCFPYDVMHTIFEGVATLHLQLLLQYLIENQHFFSMDQLNMLIRSHKYDYTEISTKPSPIKKDNSNYIIKQSASQMMTLVRMLPFFISEFIPEDDEHWFCYQIFWIICYMVLSYEVHPNDPQNLAWLIKTYLELFTLLYKRSVTPKMHYLIHLPEQMILFGPLRNHWCMRFESKNAQMKGFVTKCFKNVPLSVSIRHQQWICYQLAVHPGQLTSSFIYKGDEIISGVLCNLNEFQEIIQNIMGEKEGEIIGIRAKCVIIHGIRYEKGCVVRICNRLENEFDYCIIEAIIVHEETKIFLLSKLEVIGVNIKMCSLEVCNTNETIGVTYDSFFKHGTLQIKSKGGKHYIIEKDNGLPSLWTVIL